MAWFTDRNSFAVAVALYGVSTLYSIFLWRKGFRRDNHVSYFLLATGFLFHTLALVRRGLSLSHCPVSNLYEAITFVGWTIVTAYLAVGLWSRVRFLGAFASPILFGVGVFALFPNLDRPGPTLELDRATVSLHATLVLLSYGAFGLSAVAALMYLTQERNLKFHKLNAILSLLPPIQRLELIVSRLVVVGLVLLTAGLMVTASLLRQIPPGELTTGSVLTDAKVVWSLFIWAMYAVLLAARWRLAPGGRRMAWGALGTFAFILLTFWGTHLLSVIHNS